MARKILTPMARLEKATLSSKRRGKIQLGFDFTNSVDQARCNIHDIGGAAALHRFRRLLRGPTSVEGAP